MTEHGENCWTQHMDCAQVRIASLERENAELLGVLDKGKDEATTTQLLERQRQRIQYLEQLVVRLEAARTAAEKQLQGGKP